MSKSFLITGGSGFISANLAVTLAKQGHKITCFDNLTRRGSELLLKRISEYGCTFIHGDIRCQEDFNKLNQDYDVLIECSAHYGLNSIINPCGVIAGPWQLGKVDQDVFTYWLVQHYFKRPFRYIGFGGEGKQVRVLLHIPLCPLTILYILFLAHPR